MNPVFYDCEATGILGVPIEVGWAFVGPDNTICSEGHLIKPPDSWNIADAWDEDIERIHGISQEWLVKRGKPPFQIARRMNEVLAGRELFSDSPMDEAWLSRLFWEIDDKPTFTVRRVDANVLIAERAAQNGLSESDLEHVQEEAYKLAPQLHRAEADARHLATVWSRQRKSALDQAGLVKPLARSAGMLKNSPGVIIAVGVDGPVYRNGDTHDQLCIALDRRGVKGIGRKIFPVSGEEADYMLSFDDDFRSESRFVALPNGRNAVLCACYDMFGIAERGDESGKRARYVKWVGTHTNPIERGSESFDDRLKANLSKFRQLLEEKGVDLGIVCIHQFPQSPERKPSTAFWQRHGVASCAAALGRNGFAIGAAHFNRLPSNKDASPLAAKNVPASHLQPGKGLEREAHKLEPMDYISADVFGGEALARLYE